MALAYGGSNQLSANNNAGYGGFSGIYASGGPGAINPWKTMSPADYAARGLNSAQYYGTTGDSAGAMSRVFGAPASMSGTMPSGTMNSTALAYGGTPAGVGSNLQGNLPFANGAAGMFAQDPASGYASAYNSALQMNQQNYNNILGGYGNMANSQRAAQQQIAAGYPALTQSTLGYLQPMRDAYASQQQAQGMTQQGYGNLSNQIQNQSLQPMRDALSTLQSSQPGIIQGYNSLQQNTGAGYDKLNSGVQGTIQGIDASQRQAIADQYAASQGQATQSLTDRGLGNTTVTDSVGRGLQLDKTKADIALSNQMAALKAGYQANIGLAGLNANQNLGLAGLGYQGQALRDQTNQQNTLGSAQAGYMAQIGLPQLSNAAQNTRDNTGQANSIANAYAGYNSQLGLQGLNYADRANQQNTALGLHQLDWMNSVNARYPDPNAYMNLAQMRGANQRGAPGGQVAGGGGGRGGLGRNGTGMSGGGDGGDGAAGNNGFGGAFGEGGVGDWMGQPQFGQVEGQAYSGVSGNAYNYSPYGSAGVGGSYTGNGYTGMSGYSLGGGGDGYYGSGGSLQGGGVGDWMGQPQFGQTENNPYSGVSGNAYNYRPYGSAGVGGSWPGYTGSNGYMGGLYSLGGGGRSYYGSGGSLQGGGGGDDPRYYGWGVGDHLDNLGDSAGLTYDPTQGSENGNAAAQNPQWLATSAGRQWLASAAGQRFLANGNA